MCRKLFWMFVFLNPENRKPSAQQICSMPHLLACSFTSKAWCYTLTGAASGKDAGG